MIANSSYANPAVPSVGRVVRVLERGAIVAAQSTLLALLWLAADALARVTRLPMNGGVLGLGLLLVLLFSGCIAPRWLKAGADWLLSEMLLFFIPAAVAAVQYGDVLKAQGWRLALVVVGGTLLAMVAVAVAVEQTAKLERRLARRRARGAV
ncbi:CidA/LrgA family protein [Mycetohabitans endofungorum]|uniref:CidA/LrgA family protein n=1 Tax=Mycetohabitans endofungorum TaxID=417203 RepID=UPI002B055D6A|nr:CidA/LrgA family protein [Mycetohabitans endofungorum]